MVIVVVHPGCIESLLGISSRLHRRRVYVDVVFDVDNIHRSHRVDLCIERVVHS